MAPTPNGAGEESSLTVLAPVFNDWECALTYVERLGEVEGLPESIRVVLVDDGSTVPPPTVAEWRTRRGLSIEIVRLGTNLGHQKAIACGLVALGTEAVPSTIAVTDIDGEDDPADVARLWAAHRGSPGDLVVAQRRQRTEPLRFKLFYRLYRLLFRVLTGARLDFGNFAVIPPEHLHRLVLTPSLWSHFPATLMRSRLPMKRVGIDRGRRFFGSSRMNFISLVNHGLAGVAAFADVVYARLLLLAGGVGGLLAAVIVVGVVVRLQWGAALPGWLALLAAVSVLSLLQIVATLLVVSFLTIAIGARSTATPMQVAPQFIAGNIRVPSQFGSAAESPRA